MAIQTKDLNLMAQDFFEAHVVDYAVDNKCMKVVITEIINFWATGKSDHLKPETKRLVMGLLNYMAYQMETRIQSTGDPLVTLPKESQAHSPSLDQ